MPAPTHTLLIEGPFEDLAEELAQYLDNVRKAQGDESSNVHSEVTQDLERSARDEALKKLVVASAVLNSAPEKDFIAAYNLLVHLISQSPHMNNFLQKVCNNLSSPVSSSSGNGAGMALSILTTIFNVMQPDNELRYNVFLSIMGVVKRHGLYDSLRPQLKNIDRWLEDWESDEEDRRKLFLEVAEIAKEAGEEEDSYQYLLRALRTVTSDEVSSAPARSLALRALKSALVHPSHFDFQDLIAVDSIQALRRSDPIFFELLEIFSAKNLDDYEDFTGENEGWIEEQGLDDDKLYRKMRLLTLASLAASTPSRSLPYGAIARALQIPSEDVEVWVIDVIRAGLVEGKLSQMNQTFLIHRSTYRVFGERQWREIATRLDTWKESLRGVLQVIKAEREHMDLVKERENREADGRGGGMAGGRRGAHREPIDVGLD